MMRLDLAMAGAGALVAGLALGWGARGVVADHFQVPALVEQLDQQCALVTERASAEAIVAEQLRQFQIAERVTQSFITKSQAAADDAKARQDVLEMEIEHYVQRAHSQGGDVCALDADALELLGLREAAGTDQPGGR